MKRNYGLSPQDNELINHSSVFAQKVWTTIESKKVKEIWDSATNEIQFIKFIEKIMKDLEGK